MSDIYFQLTCMFFSILLIVVYFSKKKIANLENKIFKKIIIINFIGLLLDIITYLWLYKVGTLNIAIILCRLILVFLLSWITMLTMYIILISVEQNYNRFKKVIIIFFIISLISILYLPMEIVEENNHYYSNGIAVKYLYFTSIVYIILWIVLMFKNIKSIFKKNYYPMFAYMGIGIVVIVIQYKNPWCLLMVPMETFITFLMYHTIENPDIKLLKELHNSKEISDNANEEKTLFIYNLTQDIRNISGAIEEDANYILNSKNWDETYECARNIKFNSAKFITMTNEILDISQVDSTNIKTHNNRYSIKNTLRQIINVYSNICKNKNLYFRTNIDHNIPDILYGDGIGLKEAITTILNNSLKHTTKGFIELNVNTIIKNNVCRLIITIEDSGIGIKSEEINDIKNNDESLSKVNKLITLMHGTMIISSSYGLGTKIKVILDQRIEIIENAEIKKYDNDLKDIKILAIDDSESGLKIIEKLLKGTNIILNKAYTGKECIDKIKNNKYDLIILDEELSQIKATELIKKIKEIRNFKTPIVLLTKDNNHEYNQEYLKEGFTGYILKPIKKDVIISKIKTFINNKK